MHKTDWFYNKRWGVFNHYLYGAQLDPEHPGKAASELYGWNEYVNKFDTDLLAKQLHEAGAGYYIITIMQRSQYMLAPNETYNKITGYKPGEACCERDLIADLIKSLDKYDIPLGLYYTGDGPLNDPKAGKSMGNFTEIPGEHPKDPVSVEFVTKWASVAAEYSKRYGDKIKLWWVDGCYDFNGYDEEKLAIMAAGVKAGNPNALVSLNCGVKGDRVYGYSLSDDFTTGEMLSFEDVPDQRFIDGAQWHTLSYLSPVNWGAPGTRYDGAYMRDYVNRVHEKGGVVSIDCAVRVDGSIDPEQLEVLKAINK